MVSDIQDRNGVYIKEGDILRHRQNNSATAKVVFDGDTWWAVHLTLPKKGEYFKHLAIWEPRQKLKDYVCNDFTAKAEIISSGEEGL